MKANPRLKVVGVHGVGCDHVDLVAASELGKTVCNTPDALTVTVAEMALALTLALLRKVVAADKAVRKNEWSRKYSDLIGAEQIGKIKDEVYIINTARGRVIDEKALIKALQSGKIKAAALDVFEKEPLSTNSPLCRMDNVILTPHLGASNIEGMQRMALQVAEGVLKSIQGKDPKNRVV
jgi:phosphoglycerate dehydrogenase-like enzyme